MDSEHRHELKESDLANFLAAAKTWWGKHQTKVLLLAIVLAAAILYIRYSRASARNAHESKWVELNREMSPDALAKISESSTDPVIRTLAALRAGDELLNKAIKPTGQGEEPVTDAQRATALDQAEALFSSVVKNAPNKDYAINAQFRLATIAEQRGKWDEARQLYQAIQKDAGEGYEAFAARAAGLEKAIARAKTVPVFGPEPKPVVTPDPTNPDPTKTDPTKTDPTKIDPSKDAPAKDGATKTDPTKDSTPAKDAATKDAAPKDGATKDAATKDAATKDGAPAKDAAPKTEPTKDAAPAKDAAEKK